MSATSARSCAMISANTSSHLMKPLTVNPSAGKTSAPTVTAAVTQAEIDAEYIRSLELLFVKQKQQLEADQSRARK